MGRLVCLATVFLCALLAPFSSAQEPACCARTTGSCRDVCQQTPPHPSTIVAIICLVGDAAAITILWRSKYQISGALAPRNKARYGAWNVMSQQKQLPEYIRSATLLLQQHRLSCN
ncbi:hypothetical protein B566_EDAN002136 [Ephemera danica]|nr:hypothetical protein B566_EDAN002136 [Ephemera danica]